MKPGLLNVHASTSHLTQARKSGAGYGHGNEMGYRVGSSVTTYKPDFRGAKSIQGHNMANVDERITDRDLLANESLPDIKATPVSNGPKRKKLNESNKDETTISVGGKTNQTKKSNFGLPNIVTMP